MEMKVTPERFKQLLPLICDKETSSDPDNWTPENPLWGHCAIVSLVAQNLFGGELLRGSLMEVPGFERMRSHYWNKLADGSIEDFTKSQFGERYPEGLKAETPSRLTSNQIEAARKAMMHHLTKVGKSWIRIFPDRPITAKAAEVGMGKGKGDLKGYCFQVKPGRILFEVDGVSPEIAKEALRKAGTKLSCKTRVVARD